MSSLGWIAHQLVFKMITELINFFYQLYCHWIFASWWGLQHEICCCISILVLLLTSKLVVVWHKKYCELACMYQISSIIGKYVLLKHSNVRLSSPSSLFELFSFVFYFDPVSIFHISFSTFLNIATGCKLSIISTFGVPYAFLWENY